jgi:N-acetylated-alpha-linked acidic dipeptidase
VFEEWLGRSEDDLLPGHPRFGHLGGGSDHVGFYCHLGIPSAGLSVGGSKGVSYHSAYDDLTWYRKVVGDDYQPAVVLTRIVNTLLARLANAAVLPMEPSRYGDDVLSQLDALSDRARDLGREPDFEELEAAAERYETRADLVYRRILRKLAGDELSDSEIACVNTLLLRLERRWLTEPGIPDRPWFRSLYAATDESSGYAAWMLPALRYGIEHKDTGVLKMAKRRYLRVFERLNEATDAMEACVETRHLGR